MGRYLKGTSDKGLIFKPNGEALECFVDADFSGNWDPEDSGNIDTARSRTGFIIMYAGCPIYWKSKMQTIIALSTTEAEYVALSTALRDLIPLMRLLNEMKAQGFECQHKQAKVSCRVFEDNSGALEIATNHKVRPRTKHINVQYHHFRSYVNQGDIKILPIDMTDQRADILTKPVAATILTKLRLHIMGW